MQLLDSYWATVKGWHTSKINVLNIVCDILGSIRLEVLVAGAAAGLLVKPFLQIRFFVSDELANFDELGAYFPVTPLFEGPGFSIFTEKEFCSLFGIYSGHGSVLLLCRRPINEKGSAANLTTLLKLSNFRHLPM